MAILVTKSPIRAIRGRTGGNIYRHSQYGQHAQKTPRLVKKLPNTTQRTIRTCFRACLNYYYHELTDSERQQWITWSKNNPVNTNKYGFRFSHPFGAFSHFNITRCQEALSLLRTPPQ